jgi:hypothetical protein
MEAVAGAYRAVLEEARESFAREELAKALVACERAVALCPRSDAGVLQKEIEDRIAWRQKQIESRWSFKARITLHKAGKRLSVFFKDLGFTVRALISRGLLVALALVIIVGCGILLLLTVSKGGGLIVLGIAPLLLCIYLITQGDWDSWLEISLGLIRAVGGALLGLFRAVGPVLVKIAGYVLVAAAVITPIYLLFRWIVNNFAGFLAVVIILGLFVSSLSVGGPEN